MDRASERKPDDEISPHRGGQAGCPRNHSSHSPRSKEPPECAVGCRSIEGAVCKAGELPRLGHVREELRDDNALVLAITGVLVIYDPTLKPLTILRVIHAGRDLKRIAARGD